MTLNLSVEDLFSFLLMAVVFYYLIPPKYVWVRLRIVAWIGVWQIFTPRHPVLVDTLMMLSGFIFLEFMYFTLVYFTNPEQPNDPV
jgi:hypothetical protein